MAETLEKFFKRRYWVFCAEHCVIEFGIDNLVWSKNTFEKAEALAKDSPYSHNYLLDKETGQVTAFINNEIKTYKASSLIKNNQMEYNKLKVKKQAYVDYAKSFFNF